MDNIVATDIAMAQHFGWIVGNVWVLLLELAFALIFWLWACMLYIPLRATLDFLTCMQLLFTFALANSFTVLDIKPLSLSLFLSLSPSSVILGLSLDKYYTQSSSTDSRRWSLISVYEDTLRVD